MEAMMQYVWQHRLWIPPKLTTTDGRRVEVLDPGLLNRDAGPDFFNAKIRIGGNTWVGNIELHMRASDWHRHHHDGNPAYDSVILHVVGESDCLVARSDGEYIPQIVMPVASGFAGWLHEFMNNPRPELACAGDLRAADPFHIREWAHSLLFQRLQRKAAAVAGLAARAGGDWGQAIYVVFARALGFGINAEPFERLAHSLPLKILRKHFDSLPLVEAMLFGQAGLLDTEAAIGAARDDVYVGRLMEDYRFMAAKFGLKAMSSPGWRMARMRPANFPHRRIAALAACINQGFAPAYRITTIKNLNEALEIFGYDISGYWAQRYSFGAPSARSAVAFSLSSRRTLVINVVVPVLYAYGRMYADDRMADLAVEMLQKLPPEDNSITRLFAAAGVEIPDAFTSQALIELRRNFCEPRKCLYCRLGHRFMALRAAQR